MEHCLIGRGRLGNVTKVYSHPQALGQCSDFIIDHNLRTVPTYDTDAQFTVLWCQTETAHYFLRSDKKHATAIIKTSGNSSMSSTLTIDQGDIGGSHKYYTAPANNKHQTSVALHNTNGLVISASSTPEELQFNDFKVALTASADNKFDEDFKVHVQPFSLFSQGGGTSVAAGYVANTDGGTKSLRIDTKSINNNRSDAGNANNAFGQHVRSGDADYPALGTNAGEAGGDYDHDQDISSNASYTSEMQLVNGKYQTPTAVGAAGYKDYAGFYFPGGISLPNYSAITADASYRWHTLKYTGRISSGTYERVRLTLTQNGLTVDFSQFDVANHKLLLRVTGGAYATAGWLDCTNSVGPNGVQAGANNTRCIEAASSTANQRDCYVLAGTDSSAVFYVRVGLRNNIDCDLTNVQLQAVTSF